MGDLHQQSRGCHAAAWAGLDGTLQAVREDVGRHNALDELIAKCAGAGIGTLATACAPTALAIRMAQSAGLRQLGFCRDGRAVEYTAPGPQGCAFVVVSL